MLYASSNCISPGGVRVLCCVDQCEGLMAAVTSRLSSVRAPPAAVAATLAALPSETIAAPRKLSQALRSRLDEIAGTHGGWVPLQGRLFAQVMHGAFPNECPHPRDLRGEAGGDGGGDDHGRRRPGGGGAGVRQHRG